MAAAPWTRDELLLACELVYRNNWDELRQNSPDVLELSDLLQALPLHPAEARADPKFRSPGSVSRKTADLATAVKGYRGAPTKGGKATQRMVDDFTAHPEQMLHLAGALRDVIASGDALSLPQDGGVPPGEDEADPSAYEGRVLLGLALRRERSPGLRERKIQKTIQSGLPLECGACTFDFGRTYGELGARFIEVHHVIPLYVAGARRTRLSDLALLCANCHRMCHRPFGGRSWRTPDEVQAIMSRAAADRHAASDS